MVNVKNPRRKKKTREERYRYTGKENLDLKETINHCNVMAKRKEDERNQDIEACERDIRAHHPMVVSITGPKYRNSPFWDKIHGNKDKSEDS